MTITNGQDTLDQIYLDYANDTAFDFLRRDSNKLVKGTGPLDPAVIFIGEAPGANEDKKGLPFVGRAGHYLDKLLKSIELDRADVFMTNIVKYRPKDNRDPTYGEIVQSKKYLDRELALLDCNIIVPLGRHALSVFLPNHQLKEAHGRSFHIESEVIIPQYHPAVGLYRPDAMGPVLESDFQQIALVLDALEN
jgi:DNA polymerase